MFVRKKRNKSGSISVQVIDKSNGYRVFKTIGSSKDPEKVRQLVARGWDVIKSGAGRQEKLFSLKTSSELAVQDFIGELANSQIHTIGPELIFGTLFDRIGFGKIEDELFRHIAIASLAYPASKLKTVDYLKRYQGIEVKVDAVYRFLDRLAGTYKEAVEQTAFEYSKRTLKGISVVFYDLTTLYFEAEDEDDLRKIGLSKDGKFQHPQILLGLLVGQGGYPIAYDIFEGNTFEGHTLLPMLSATQEKYLFKKPVVIADAALLSKANLAALAGQGYRYIIGGRIKNESREIKRQILKQAKDLNDGDAFAIKKPGGTRLVISFSARRQRKDAHNRERGLRKLRARVKSGRLTKKSINNRGYNKFLTLKSKVEIQIDEDKIKEDQRWDGLKGYVTNTRLAPRNIIENYGQLWQIERAFRISKTDLRIRPIRHRLKNRIEAHVCIAFVAYTIYKELERLLLKHHINFSAKRAAELTHNMYELEYKLPSSARPAKIILKMDEEQLALYGAVRDG